MLNKNQTRQLYYLQLRQNYLNIRHNYIGDEKYFQLASLALVADLGTYVPSKHVNMYFNLNSYFPSWIIEKFGATYIYKTMPKLHKQISNQTKQSALNKFCCELSNDDCPYNLHLYQVYKNKDETPGSIVLGISPKGILVFELREAQEISLISTFNWSSITKLNVKVTKLKM